MSRTVILGAFEQLLAEGYVEGRRGSGTYVASPLPDQALASFNRGAGSPTRKASRRLSRYGRRALAAAPLAAMTASQGVQLDFRYGFAPPEPESQATWRRVLSQAASRLALDYAPAAGDPALRAVLASHLARHRGVRCDPEQVVVVGGSQQALDLATRLLLDPGDRVVIEEPHYLGARAVFRAAGARLVPVRVDGAGLDLPSLARRRLDARLAYVTPSHQFPTGAIMSLARRLALLEWAERQDAFVLEDDYDSEFRYEGRPVEAVQALDTRGRTLYVGTFSKVLFPSLRLGFVVVPEALVEVFQAGKWLVDRHSPLLEQSALAEFLETGLYDRHLRRMRRRHASRRAALIEAIRHELGDAVEVMGTEAGIHLVMWLREVRADDIHALLEAASEAGVGLHSIAPYYLRPPDRAGLLIGYGGLDEGQIRIGIRRFAAALDDWHRSTRRGTR